MYSETRRTLAMYYCVLLTSTSCTITVQHQQASKHNKMKLQQCLAPCLFFMQPCFSFLVQLWNRKRVNLQNHHSLWSEDDLKRFADAEGVTLSLSTLGPGYRAVARAKHNTTMIIGYVEGFIRPTGALLHLDKMEVFNKIVQRCREENPVFCGGGTTLGVGLLLGYLCLLHGQRNDCQYAEFLAIYDEDFQHKRLVRYYKAAGFRNVKYVGDALQDVPDRIVWGGCGTLLRAEVKELLGFWTGLMVRSQQRRQ